MALFWPSGMGQLRIMGFVHARVEPFIKGVRNNLKFWSNTSWNSYRRKCNESKANKQDYFTTTSAQFQPILEIL